MRTTNDEKKHSLASEPIVKSRQHKPTRHILAVFRVCVVLYWGMLICCAIPCTHEMHAFAQRYTYVFAVLRSRAPRQHHRRRDARACDLGTEMRSAF